MILHGYYAQKLDGRNDKEALVISFETKTPFAVWFDRGTPCAFRYGDRMVVEDVSPLDGRTEVRRRSFIDGIETGEHESRLDRNTFERELNALVRRLFEPPHLDVDTPPGIVADWLRDRGLDLAASKVMEAEAERTGDGGKMQSGRMVQVMELIEELQGLLARWGNTCLYIRDLSWGAVALNRKAADDAARVGGTEP